MSFSEHKGANMKSNIRVIYMALAGLLALVSMACGGGEPDQGTVKRALDW